MHKPGKLKTAAQLFLGPERLGKNPSGFLIGASDSSQGVVLGLCLIASRLPRVKAKEKVMSGKRLQIEIGELKAKNVKWVVNLKGQKRQKNGEVITLTVI